MTQLCVITGKHRNSLYRQIQDGRLPKPLPRSRSRQKLYWPIAVLEEFLGMHIDLDMLENLIEEVDEDTTELGVEL